MITTGFFTYSSYAALTTTTANTIQGTAPYFATTGANKVDLNDFKYFGIRFNGTDYYDFSDLNDAINATALLNSTFRPHDLYTVSGAAGNLLSLSPLGQPIAAEVIDDDGDGNPNITTLPSDLPEVGWYFDYNGTEYELANRGDDTICSLASRMIVPYLKVTGGIDLNTQFGDPPNQSYPDPIRGFSTPSRTFNLEFFNGVVCTSQPVGGYTSEPSHVGSQYDMGTGGFHYQGGTNNFPTTAFDGHDFDIWVAGVDVSKLSWYVNGQLGSTSSGNVTVELSKHSIVPGNWSSQVARKVKLNVKFTGPKASSLSPATALPFSGPATFVIEGKKGSTTVVTYSFILKKWYIGDAGVSGHQSQVMAWCNGLNGNNYQLASVKELTNASGTALGNGGAIPAFSPASLASPGNYYYRSIGGGLFAEWGPKNASTMPGGYIWTRDILNSSNSYFIRGAAYSVSTDISTRLYNAICVSRP